MELHWGEKECVVFVSCFFFFERRGLRWRVPFRPMASVGTEFKEGARRFNFGRQLPEPIKTRRIAPFRNRNVLFFSFFFRFPISLALSNLLGDSFYERQQRRRHCRPKKKGRGLLEKKTKTKKTNKKASRHGLEFRAI